jgi:peptidoglycan hydrolase-like protein with peptidoglycan-binding domain
MSFRVVNSQLRWVRFREVVLAQRQVARPVVRDVSVPSDGRGPGAPAAAAQPSSAWTGNHPAPGTTSQDAWLPTSPPVKGDPAARSAQLYDQVINQFAVGVNPRYAQRGGNTYCNIFLWDVTRAMGVEIPHWVDGAGNPQPPFSGRELDANDTHRWLNQHGARFGWRKVDAAEAQVLANAGHPAVASWLNPGGIGHVGVVRPGQVGPNGPALAQAGAKNFNQGSVFDVFPRNGTEFWVNDSGRATEIPSTPPAPPPQAPAVAGAPGIDLQRGTEGEEVRSLQASLVQLGHMSQADMDTGPGTFGPRTEAAVKSFQGAHGVPTTGYYGPLTRAALEKALAPAPAPEPAPPPAPAASVPGMDLERGMESDDVRSLQASLVQLGHMSQEDMDTGPGTFGPRTEAAVKSFQGAHGVPTTGYYGPLTRAALTAALNGAQPVAPVAPPAPSGVPGAEQAIAYATNPPPNPMDPSGSWHYWCLGLVNKAYQSAGRPLPELAKPRAWDSYLAYANAGKVQTGGNPPRGALVFFNSFMPYGHIGISLGDGRYIGTLESGAPTGVRTIANPTFVGWAYP